MIASNPNIKNMDIKKALIGLQRRQTKILEDDDRLTVALKTNLNKVFEKDDNVSKIDALKNLLNLKKPGALP